MFELNQLEQLLAIAEYKTVSKAAEELHLSQPALSRSIKRLEDELQVSLFERQKNKMTLNQNGELALEYAKKILDEANNMEEKLQAFERSQHTISLGACAPVPLWQLTPLLSRLYPDMVIQSELKTAEQLIRGLDNNIYKIIITVTPSDNPEIVCQKYCEEHLFVSLPPAHPLAGHKELHLNDLNGQSVLILSKIGFWYDICKEKMPDSLFLVQEEISALDELRKSSALPSFATDLTGSGANNENRILIPLLDPEVNVTFYYHIKKSNAKIFQKFILEIALLNSLLL